MSSKSYKKDAGKYLLLIITVLVFVLLFVAMKVRIVSLNKEIDDLNQTITKLNNITMKLRVEEQDLMLRDRVAEIAINKLGMVYGDESNDKIFIEKEFLSDKDKEISRALTELYENR